MLSGRLIPTITAALGNGQPIRGLNEFRCTSVAEAGTTQVSASAGCIHLGKLTKWHDYRYRPVRRLDSVVGDSPKMGPLSRFPGLVPELQVVMC